MKLGSSGSRAINVDPRYPYVGTSAPTQDDWYSKTIKCIISSYGFLIVQIPKLRYSTIGLVARISEFGFDRAQLIVCHQHDGSLFYLCSISRAQI
jgi:hypothetical protein